MFFTQEDYKKIQQWLTKNSVKDTEFNKANIPFNGNEIVSIVQGNQNKKVFLKDLVSQIFNLGVSDFINITDKYDAPNISLEEAIRLIPSRARKEGQVITFLDREDHWHIYQFKGVLNQWNVLDTWEDLFDWEKLIINSILPDEEDLTKSLPDANGNSYLSLKDRKYNPEDFSGLGKVIIRKNIVEVEDPIYGKAKKNVLYQDMINKSNTIYEIRYDFDLNGQEITIPEGCVLDFQGGSFNNGTLIGNNTNIDSNFDDIFDQISILGSWSIKNIYSSWFKDRALKNGLKNVFSLSNDNIENNIYLKGDLYEVSIDKYDADTYKNGALYMTSNTKLYIAGEIRLVDTDFRGYQIISCLDKTNIEISGGKITGNNQNHSDTGGEWGLGISIFGGEYISISNVEISQCWGDGIFIGAGIDNTKSKYITVNNSLIHDNRRQGISIVEAEEVRINNCEIYNIKGTWPQSGIDLEPQTADVNNIIIENCYIHDCIRGIDSNGNVGPKFVTISNNKIFTESWGIRMFNASNFNITNNYIEGDEVLINFSYINNNILIENNYLKSNTEVGNTSSNSVILDGKYLLEEESSNVIINNNIINAPNCACVSFRKGDIFSNNKVISKTFCRESGNNKAKNVNISNNIITVDKFNSFFSDSQINNNTIEAKLIEINDYNKLYDNQLNLLSSLSIPENCIIKNNNINNNSGALEALNIGANVQLLNNNINEFYIRIDNDSVDKIIIIQGNTIKREKYNSTPVIFIPKCCSLIIDSNIIHNLNSSIDQFISIYNMLTNINIVTNNIIIGNALNGNFINVNSSTIDNLYCGGNISQNGNIYGHNSIVANFVNYNIDKTLKHIGNTEERPTLNSRVKNFQFFDTVIGKPIWWNGTKWVDATGANI